VRLLTDGELVAYVTASSPIVEGMDPQVDWYSNGSPIQSSSIDLHIGKIYLPGVQKKTPGTVSKPKKEHILRPGRTAVIITREEFRLPSHIAGFGFPPSHVSFQGILMTNPGHVDPGYAGPMRFTVINMGSQDYILSEGKEVVTMLLFELSQPCHRDWLQRHSGHAAALPSQDDIDKLSADFLDVDRRATEISQKTVHDAELSIKIRQWRAPIIVALVALLGTILTAYFTWAKPAWKELDEAKREIAVLKATIDVGNMKTRLDELERLIKNTSQPPQPTGGSQKGQP
jgi:dCTP deaminase